MAANYSRETIDAFLSGLRAEWRADLNKMVGELRTEMAAMEGRLVARIEGLRGEWKVWLIVLGTVLAVLSSGVGARLLDRIWPQTPSPQSQDSPRLP